MSGCINPTSYTTPPKQVEPATDAERERQDREALDKEIAGPMYVHDRYWKERALKAEVVLQDTFMMLQYERDMRQAEREQTIRECADFIQKCDGPVIDRTILAAAILALLTNKGEQRS